MASFVASGDQSDIFSMLYVTERDGCVPEELLEDELLSGIHAMYYAVLDGLRDELRERTRTRDSMSILVDPSYEDTTAFALITDDLVLCTGWRKAWHFYWDSEDEMAEELEGWYQPAAERLFPSSP